MISAMWSKCGCATTAPVSRPRSGTNCFSRSSRPSRPAKAPGSACRSPGTSSRNSTAARSVSTARLASSLNSQFDCRALTGRQSQRRRHECRRSGRGRRPDAADLFQQRFGRETGNSPHDQTTAYPARPIDSRGPRKRRLWGMRTRSRDRRRVPAVGSVNGPSRGPGAMGETRRKIPWASG